ncbi:hydroxypyruvate reductase/glycerate 2-kinase [Persephonella hydrogeniphila]|uniref:Hydroxypyruvate reductase/glycerate 2-kinase n=1 Tax=Persephonella hydrogeniphila TaxID=198703 RepID=A0A285N2C7_9AQUI|nr:glycerate kinase [Persephonella hydrogeniphila]SNZ03589.1 hydroxypyruvate reductase/glycerate 2-kinase [Persephonella hydrogeniphila]
MNLRQLATELFLYGVESVKPENLIPQTLSLTDSTLQISSDSYQINKKIYILGSGKASVEMAKAIENLLGERIAGGIVVCNYEEKLKKIKVFKGSHPVPDENSVKGAEAVLNFISSLKEDDFFIYLLSGGSSALIEKPFPPITIEDLQKTTKLLLRTSVPIEEINVVRKHLSMVKGGRLGRATKAKGIVLVISDVIGDDLFTIGSAPLYYDRSTYKDAYEILKKYDLLDKIPESVRTVIVKGIKGEIPETPKEENPNIKHYIIGSNINALKKIKEKAEKTIKTYIMTSQLKGEAREVSKAIVSIGKEIKKSSNPFRPPVCLLFGGETTVNVKGNGKGGRNQEICLSGLIEIKDTENFVLLSGGTDGIDGNSDAAGAVVDRSSYEKAKKLDLNLYQYLNNNDSYSFFEKTGDLIKTGPTGTNVMDITIIVVGG